MTVIMHNAKENDYTIHCNSCGSEEICDHEYGLDKTLESIDYCVECCEKCDREAYIDKQGIENTQGLIRKDLLLE
jgi:hypothetical protein